MKLLITGASGQLGRQVAGRVLETVEPTELILTTRSPDDLTEFADRGVEVRAADFERPETLVAAFAGVDRMLLISTDAIGRRVSQHSAAIDAAVRAGVAFIAYTSFPSVGTDDVLSAEHAATERLIRSSGAAWSILRNFPYADNETLALHEALERGELLTNVGAAATAFVARTDCAAVAAAVLVGEGHEGSIYDVTGPELVSAEDRARVFAEVGGAPVAVRYIDDEELARDVSSRGGPPEPIALAMVRAIGGATRDGVFAVLSDTVERLTGSPAMPLASVLRGAAGTM